MNSFIFIISYVVKEEKYLSISSTTTKNNSNIDTNSDNEKSLWSENLKKNEDQRRKNRQWFSMQPGEKTVLEFLPQFGSVMKDFDGDGVAETLRYEYKVIDVNHRDAGAKPWDVSKRWSEGIDHLLQQGHHILKVERVGAGMKTSYYFTPVDNITTSSAVS